MGYIEAIFENWIYRIRLLGRLFSKPPAMEGKRRVIFFLLLVTLSSGQGLDFSFTEKGYAAVLEAESIPGVEFRATNETLHFTNEKASYQWRANTFDVTREGSTTTRKIIPRDPQGIRTKITSFRDDYLELRYIGDEFLSYIEMSFSKVSYELPNVLNPDVTETQELTYGKLALCFIDDLRERRWPPRSERETCLYTLMFTIPKHSSHQKYMTDNAVRADPISEEQIDNLLGNVCMSWELDSLPSALLRRPNKKAFIHNYKDAIMSKLGRSLGHDGAAFYLKPIVVLKAVMQKYYQFVTQGN